jgi:hypothetical protein
MSAALNHLVPRTSVGLIAVALDMRGRSRFDSGRRGGRTSPRIVGSKVTASGLRFDGLLNCECAVFGGTGIEFVNSIAPRQSGGGRFVSFAKTSVQTSGATSSNMKGLLPCFWKGEITVSSVQPSQVRSVISDPE